MKNVSASVDTQVVERPEAADEAPTVQAMQAGDRAAFAQFVRRHQAWVRGVVYASVGRRDRVEDVCQQVWMSVWQRVAELRDPQRWRPWLFRLARNAAFDAGREQKRRQSWLDGFLRNAPPASASEASDAEASTSERHQDVLAAIEGLPAIYREPFVLRHVCGWSYRQIADALDMPVDTVETRLVRAMRQLRQALRAQGVME